MNRYQSASQLYHRGTHQEDPKVVEMKALGTSRCVLIVVFVAGQPEFESRDCHPQRRG